MSFAANKKVEHETAAEKALAEKNFAKAFFHTTKAAEFTLTLAEETEGKISKKYVEDAFGLIEIAEKLKEKASAKGGSPLKDAIRQGKDEGDAGGVDWRMTEKPTTKLEDVAGLKDVKEELRKVVIEPFKHPEAYKRFRIEAGGGLLLYGPPGNGKTMIAAAIAGELDAAFFRVELSKVVSKWVGDTEKHLTSLFTQAKSYPKSVVFLDEVDALLASRGRGSTVMDRAVPHFLSLVDGIEPKKNCLLLLGATNRPDILDEAVIRPGRFGKAIYVGLPDEPAREEIFRLNMKEVPADADIDYPGLAKATEGYSGADLREVCNEAKQMAKDRQISTGTETNVSKADFDSALQKVKPSVTNAVLKRFEKWKEEHGR